MSFKFEREKTNNTPYVFIDEEKSYMKLEGECYLEDIINFFREVNDWLEQYLASDFGVFTFDCALEYFNSSTTKLLYNMLRAMDEASAGENNVIVNWIADAGDDMIIECGEDFKEEMEHLEFNFIDK